MDGLEVLDELGRFLLVGILRRKKLAGPAQHGAIHLHLDSLLRGGRELFYLGGQFDFLRSQEWRHQRQENGQQRLSAYAPHDLLLDLVSRSRSGWDV